MRAGFRRHSTYRLALLAGMTTNSVFGIIRAYILLAALASAGSSIGGYDAPMTVAFVWWGQALLGTVNLWGFTEVKDRVRTGDIAVDFLRPVNPQLAYLAADLGRAGINLVGRGTPPVLLRRPALRHGLAAVGAQLGGRRPCRSCSRRRRRSRAPSSSTCWPSGSSRSVDSCCSG